MNKTTQADNVNKGRITGRLVIDGKQVSEASDLEITPGGNNTYAITCRLTLTTDIQVFNPDTLGAKPVELTYTHKLLPKERSFMVEFLDSGITDIDGKVTVILFFRGRGKELVKSFQPKVALV